MSSKAQSVKITISCYFLAWILLTSLLFFLYSSQIPEKLSFSTYCQYIFAPFKGNSIFSKHYQDALGPIIRNRAIKTMAIIVPSLLTSLLIANSYSRRKPKRKPGNLSVLTSALPLFWLAMLFIATALGIGKSVHGDPFFTILITTAYFVGHFITLIQRLQIKALNSSLTKTGLISYFQTNINNNTQFKSLVLNNVYNNISISSLILSGNYMLLELVMDWPGLGRELLQSFLIGDISLSLAATFFTLLIILLINMLFNLARSLYIKK